MVLEKPKNYPLAIFANDDFIDEADTDKINFKKPLGQGAVQVKQAFCARIVGSGPVYDEYHLEETLIQ